MIRPMEKRNPVSCRLVGIDGNAFSVIGTVRAAMKEAEWTAEEIDEVVKDMMSGDYDHLLQVAVNHCDVW